MSILLTCRQDAVIETHATTPTRTLSSPLFVRWSSARQHTNGLLRPYGRFAGQGRTRTSPFALPHSQRDSCALPPAPLVANPPYVSSSACDEHQQQSAYAGYIKSAASGTDLLICNLCCHCLNASVVVTRAMCPAHRHLSSIRTMLVCCNV